MINAAGHILKSSEVNFEGRLQLDLISPHPAHSEKRHISSVSPQATIVESSPEFAVIEVTCSCGTKIQLKCEYVPNNTSQNQKTEQ